LLTQERDKETQRNTKKPGVEKPGVFISSLSPNQHFHPISGFLGWKPGFRLGSKNCKSRFRIIKVITNRNMITLAGYQISDILYQGTRTEVYRGHQNRDRQPVIMKVLRNPHPNFNELAQFRNQYIITRSLEHSGIVQPLALERYGNGYALIMPDQGAISLADYWQESARSLSEFLNIAIQLADVLHDLNQQRIIHKDIKPANILICPETHQVKLIDFSISSLLPQQQQQLINPNILEGTLAYISPEQTGRMNRGIDYRTDFYSLGVTFYELLTGQLPFPSDDPMELVHCHIAKMPILGNGQPGTGNRERAIEEMREIEEIEEIEEIRDTSDSSPSFIPQVLADIVLKLMAKNAEDRYQSALGLKHDLEQCLQQWGQTGDMTPFELGQRDICDRFTIPEKLYGREKEVAQLLAAFERIASSPSSQSELMLVAGFSGIGKTAVINEVHKPIVQRRGYFIKGKFDQFNRSIPLSAFVQALRDLMNQLLGESDAEIDRWKTNILKALGEQGQVIIEVIPELENIIGQQPDVSELSGKAAQNRFNRLFGKLIQVFATKEHPLVIFIDDLQWADSASLNLIQLLMTETQTSHLLLVGAYRDNEVYPAHPLMLTLDRLGDRLTKVQTITLAPLPQKDINLLVANTLSCDVDLAKPLTELIYQKTQGNPFFTNQFLKSLYEDGWIQFNVEAGYWQCDLTRVRELSLTDDVVKLMADRINKLSAETRSVLKLAACIGNQFDLETLTIVSELSQTETAASLWPALTEGLVLPNNETYKFYQADNREYEWEPLTINDAQLTSYNFLHDRVQQAAYLLIPETEKQSTHWKIGQLLLKNIPAAQREEHIFEIVNQLNYGIELLEKKSPLTPLNKLNQGGTESQHYQLAELNFMAGTKAKTATAYESALQFANLGLQLLPPNSWQEDYQLTLALHNLATEVAYLNGDFEQMETYSQVVLERANKVFDTVKVYTVKILALIAQQKLPNSVDIGLEILQLLGIKLSLYSTATEIEQATAKTRDMIQKVGFESLLSLPRMTDENSIAVLEIMKVILPPAAMVAPPLFMLITFSGVNLSIAHGNGAISPYIYTCYGLLSFVANDLKSCYEFGNLALQLLSQSDDKEADVKSLINVGAFTHHWKCHLKDCVDYLHSGYLIGLEVGELDAMAWNGFFENQVSYFMGQPLESLHQKIVDTSQVFREVKQELQLNHNERVRQVVLNLMGHSPVVDELMGEAYNQEQALAKYQGAKDQMSMYYLYVYKTILGYLFGNYQGAWENMNQAAGYIDSATSQIVVAIFYFYQSLTELSLYHDLSETEQKAILEQVSSNQDKMQHWASYAPMNYQHKFDLVEAEYHRVIGEKWPAAELYDRAIAGAKENEYIQEEALANELAGKFFLDWGKETIAEAYLKKAYYGYSCWGAKAKTDQLEQTYPELFALQTSELPLNYRETSTHNLGTMTTVTSLFDLSSAIEAAQTISGEMSLDTLLSKLMEIVLENAGADKGALILHDSHNSETWEIAIECDRSTCQLSNTPLDRTDNLPTSIINTVKRTQETVLINQLKKDPTFTADPYLISQPPKSLFCTPIQNQGQPIGILYLENKLTAKAFTPNRIEMLKLLAAQAAISIENARLYGRLEDYSHNLENQVQQRTKELQENNERLQNTLKQLQRTQAQLIQTEKMSSLGQMVAGMAHEINNPITFIAGNITHAREYVQDLLDLIDVYADNLPDANAAIEEKIKEIELDYVRQDLQQIFSSMQTGSDRIRKIILGLRNFSRLDEAELKDVDIHEGLENTLLIVQHRLKSHQPEIAIVKNYGQIPRIQCYANQLNQVFLNILSNAIDALTTAAAEKPLEIRITTEMKDAKTVKISIGDNGQGMSENIRQKIFDPFFTTKPVGKGTGLGLSMSYQIITEQHRGQLNCISQPGQGTEFIIEIPSI
jgi:predicted ATPase/signal transduction histidine kinase